METRCRHPGAPSPLPAMSSTHQMTCSSACRGTSFSMGLQWWNSVLPKPTALTPVRVTDAFITAELVRAWAKCWCENGRITVPIRQAALSAGLWLVGLSRPN